MSPLLDLTCLSALCIYIPTTRPPVAPHRVLTAETILFHKDHRLPL